MSCGCDPLRPAEADVANPPGQDSLRWRVAPHSQALARMRAALGSDATPPGPRALARHGTEEPVVALLDAWALVTDTVSFYTERIAQEGFLRTATELESLRMLARAIGYEPRPGVAAEAEVAFEVETAPGAPERVLVAAGTPVQSIPGPGQLPQTFETSAELEARVQWNAVPAAARRPQDVGFGTTAIWLEGTGLGLAQGDAIVVIGEERRRFARTPAHSRAKAIEARNDERWDFRILQAVDEDPDGLVGWTRLGLERRVGFRRHEEGSKKEDLELTAEAEPLEVLAFGARGALFGATAPDAALLTHAPTDGGTDIDKPFAKNHDDVIEVDGDQPGILKGSWIVLERKDHRELYAVEDVSPDGATRFGITGKLTRVRVDWTEELEGFGRRETVVHSEPRPLPARHEPVSEPMGDQRVLVLQATDPPLPIGRLVVVTGWAPGTVPEDPLVRAATAPPQAELAAVAACAVDGETMKITLDRDLAHRYDPLALAVRANVVAVTHGETVDQVLGSGDATATFQRMATRRGPLTYVRAQTPSGARSTLEVLVDRVRWNTVESLDVAGPHDRAYTARLREDATALVTTGDGRNGARLPTGQENVRARFRVGLGADGAVTAGQLAMLPRRPFGIKGATNPAPAHDWAVPEQLGEVRTNAPLRIRTLDRAVSTADHADFAADFAGVSLARADEVWDGQRTVVVVSVLGSAGMRAGDGLLTDLGDSLELAREPGTAFTVRRGEPLRFTVHVELENDPDVPRADVEASVLAALATAYTPPAMPFATGLPASRVLVTIRAVAGVVACTMPRLLVAGTERDPVVALPARFTGGDTVGAQVAALDATAVQIGAMPR
jgi:predicted phage baseplate assembly protein